MSVDTLDFVVLGAQKAGTTTLFQHLRRHPDLYLPPDKEAPFFSRPDLVPRGVSWYLHESFRDAPVDRRWGTVTPQYLGTPGTADLLLEAFPEIRLVAILRDPIARAASHHRMSSSRGLDPRSFDEAMADLVEPAHAVAARSSRSETDTYVAWSEYGRLLDDYLRSADRSQLCIVFTEDLEDDPAGVVTTVQRFLGVDEHLPDTLGERYHVGGGGGRTEATWRAARRLPGVRRVAQLVPVRYRYRLAARTIGFDGRAAPDERGGADESEHSLAPATLAAVRSHFEPEVARVRELAGAVPWSGWAG